LSKIDLSKTTTSLVGDLAIVRCHFSGISESSGKPVPTEIEVLLIWQKRGGDWKLLAREAYKISRERWLRPARGRCLRSSAGYAPSSRYADCISASMA